MIRETILTTMNTQGDIHIAPFGITVDEDDLVISPFRPSRTLDNLMDNPHAVINYTDDVQVFAGCLTHRRHWKTRPAVEVPGVILHQALAHTEVRVKKIDEDEKRPHLHCEPVYDEMHSPFQGFNRAQGAVIEAAILISRLEIMPLEQVESEIAYLSSALEKTAGPHELKAWEWLMEYLDEFKAHSGKGHFGRGSGLGFMK